MIDTLNIDEENLLKAEQRKQLKDLLKRHRDILSRNDTDIGQCSGIKHRTLNIEQLLAGGIIRPSKSPWTSNVVLVRTKNWKLRLCEDYR